MLQNMDIHQFRRLMYNRLMPGRKRYTNEFLKRIEEFVVFGCQQAHLVKGKIRYPYFKCRNMNYIIPDELMVHL